MKNRIAPLSIIFPLLIIPMFSIAEKDINSDFNISKIYTDAHASNRDAQFLLCKINEQKASEAESLKSRSLSSYESRKSSSDNQDYKRALQWCLKSAYQDNIDAQFTVGLMYDRGLGTPENYIKAIEWWTKAADQGHQIAQLNLTQKYINGNVENFVLAYKWALILASSKRKNEENELIDNFAKHMTSDELSKAEKMANDWLAQHPNTNAEWLSKAKQRSYSSYIKNNP